MPLSINVGLSKKASRNFQSTGYSINVTAELDQSLLARPEELQQQIADLYAQTVAALNQQAGSPPSAPPASRSRRPPQRAGYQARNGNVRSGAGGGNGEMTAAQRRAILAIAERLGVDPNREAVDTVGGELDALTIRQASQLIDHLHGLQPTNGEQVNGH
jgi:hypothetical protein